MKRHPTIGEAIEEKLGPNPGSGAQLRAAQEIGVSDSRFSGWKNGNVEPTGEALDGLRRWLGLRSAYDLGPYIVATKLEKARIRDQVR